MSKEKMYSIAIKRRQDSNDFFWKHEKFEYKEVKIQHDKRYWFADPFLFEKNGKCYLFYEAYDLIQEKGVIGYSVVDDTIKKLKVNVVLEKPYHFSFPNIFEYNGDVYMMPETCQTNEIKIFKAIEFPDKWIEVKTIIPNVFACDSIIIKDKGNKSFLLSSEMYRENVPNNTYASCWIQNCLYPIHNDFNINTSERVIVAEGDYGIRNAGSTFHCNGKIFRVGQDCRDKQYGRGIVMYEIISLVPYIEKYLWEKNFNDFEKNIIRKKQSPLIGIHTYNFSEHYEVVDFSQMREVASIIIIARFIRPYYLSTRHFFGRIKRALIREFKLC